MIPEVESILNLFRPEGPIEKHEYKINRDKIIDDNQQLVLPDQETFTINVTNEFIDGYVASRCQLQIAERQTFWEKLDEFILSMQCDEPVKRVYHNQPLSVEVALKEDGRYHVIGKPETQRQLAVVKL